MSKKPKTKKATTSLLTDWQKLLAKNLTAQKPAQGLTRGNRPKENRQVTHNLRRRMGR